MKTVDQTVADQLESLIDSHGLLHIVTALDLICAEKASFIRSDWQDDKTARVWDKTSNLLKTLSRRISDLKI